jgi:hypothetical protein
MSFVTFKGKDCLWIGLASLKTQAGFFAFVPVHEIVQSWFVNIL